MDVTELSKFLARNLAQQIVAKSHEQKDRVDYLSRAMARISTLEKFPPQDLTAALMQFGYDFGLLSPETTTN